MTDKGQCASLHTGHDQTAVATYSIGTASCDDLTGLVEEVSRLRLENNRLKNCLRETREMLESRPSIKFAWQL